MRWFVFSVFLHEWICALWKALRIVLQTVDTLAARYGRYIVPLLSLSIDFYLRVFLRIKTGAAAAKNNAL